MEFTELLTVPGAALAAGVFTQIAKILGMPGAWARRFALLAGIGSLLGAVAIEGGADAATWFLAVIAGGTAGLAAVGAFDAGYQAVEAIKSD